VRSVHAGSCSEAKIQIDVSVRIEGGLYIEALAEKIQMQIGDAVLAGRNHLAILDRASHTV
jgi:uncharacterized alkaline shock family protein YloU